MAPADRTSGGLSQDPLQRARLSMVADQIAARGVKDARVLDAMRAVPRHEFVPTTVREDAYVDSPLPIGHGQTISQPYIVALMTELARRHRRTAHWKSAPGPVYQAAVLSAWWRACSAWSSSTCCPVGRVHAPAARVRQRHRPERRRLPRMARRGRRSTSSSSQRLPKTCPPRSWRSSSRAAGCRARGRVWDVQDLRFDREGRRWRVSTRSVIPVRFVPMVKKRDS